MKKSFINRIVSLLLAITFMLGCLPLNSVATYAAPASDIPAKMLNNYVLDALEYIGYDVQGMKEDGKIYKVWAGGATKYLSNVTYGQDSTAGNGLEVNSKGKPDIDYFEKYGMQCGSWATYYWFNYRPNVLGIDMSYLNPPAWPMNPGSWYERAQEWIKAGYAEEVSFTIDSTTGKIKPAKTIPIGSIILFANRETGSLWTGGHVSMYAGEYDGKQFLTHVGTSRGPEFITINDFHNDLADKGGNKQIASKIIVIKDQYSEYGQIEINKKDPDGNKLAGAEFTITNKSTNTRVAVLRTDANGHAILQKVPYGSYTVTETKFPTGYVSNGTTTWTVTISDSNMGKVVINAVNKPDKGTCKIVKTSEDNIISGVSFSITGNGINKTVKTGADGTIATDLEPGTYTVTEITPSYYETQVAKTVTIKGGETTTVSFKNTIKKGSVKVTKTSEDGFVEDIQFHLYGTSGVSGQKVDMYATTNSKGVAIFKNVPIAEAEEYTLEEVDTAVRYVVPKKQKVSVNWNEVTGKSVENTLKKFRVIINKTDSEYEAAQGDATLKGAVYGLYNDGVLVEEITTNANGVATSGYHVCGDKYFVKEIKASTGYLLDSKSYKVGASAKDFTIELNSVSMDVKEDVKKGKIAIIKHCDDGTTKIETPEAGATFMVYLKSAGSFLAAKETEKDVLVCDEDGFAITKDLPFGTYIVHQQNGWEGRELMADFEVVVSQHKKTYKYLINNAVFFSYVQIVKVDAETEKAIPYAGAAFKLFDPKGKQIKMTTTYPKIEIHDVFYTNEEGYLITPEKLEYGIGYSLVETEAPYGYVLDTTPIKFDVKESATEEFEGISVVKVKRDDIPQKGFISVVKTGEIFQTVTVDAKEDESVYTPEYQLGGLKGATFEVIAAENIVTPDGTVRYKERDVVDTFTTDKDGNGKSKELYLGKYYVVETKAPYGYVLDKQKHLVELKYAGQDVQLTGIDIIAVNKKQALMVSLVKVMQIDDTFGIGKNNEIKDVLFGLYANEDITAADGSIIPKDGLIKRFNVRLDGTAGVDVNLPFGHYYIKELRTNDCYVLDKEKYEFEFKYKDQNVNTVNIILNDGKIISNEIYYGSIEGRKEDFKGNALAGAVFGLFRADEKEYYSENALMTAVSNDDGSFSFDKVPCGDYQVVEIKAPEGYVITPFSQKVTVTKDDVEAIKLETVYNKPDDNPPPHTGDSNIMNFLILIMSIALVAGVVTFSIIRKKK